MPFTGAADQQGEYLAAQFDSRGGTKCEQAVRVPARGRIRGDI